MKYITPYNSNSSSNFSKLMLKKMPLNARFLPYELMKCYMEYVEHHGVQTHKKKKQAQVGSYSWILCYFLAAFTPRTGVKSNMCFINLRPSKVANCKRISLVAVSTHSKDISQSSPNRGEKRYLKPPPSGCFQHKRLSTCNMYLEPMKGPLFSSFSPSKTKAQSPFKTAGSFGFQVYTNCWWKKVEVGSLSQHLQGFIHPRRCRISLLPTCFSCGEMFN